MVSKVGVLVGLGLGLERWCLGVEGWCLGLGLEGWCLVNNTANNIHCMFYRFVAATGSKVRRWKENRTNRCSTILYMYVILCCVRLFLTILF